MNKSNTVEKFISDEEFQNWFYSEERIDPVKKFSIANEEEKMVFDEAVTVMENLRPNKKVLNDDLIQEEWHKVKSILEAQSVDSVTADGAVNRKVKSISMTIFKYAAVVSLLILGLGWFYFQSINTQEYLTSVTLYQEKLDLDLDDGTKVKLAANSSIKSFIGSESKREVWLDGEAFFHVTKLPDHENSEFVVHAGRLDIVVLGTQFNVLRRENSVIIALKEGSVRLNGTGSKELLMNPGQVIRFDEDNQSFETGSREDSYYYAWLEDKIILDETSLSELSVLIHEKFGVAVQIRGDSLKSRKLSGVVPDQDLDVIINAIRNSLDVNVDYKNEDIVIY